MSCELSKNAEGFVNGLIANDGNYYRLKITGCLEGLSAFDADGEYVATIPLEVMMEEGERAAIETLCAAIEGIQKIEHRAEVRRLDELKADIQKRMAEKGFTGEVFLNFEEVSCAA